MAITLEFLMKLKEEKKRKERLSVRDGVKDLFLFPPTSPVGSVNISYYGDKRGIERMPLSLNERLLLKLIVGKADYPQEIEIFRDDSYPISHPVHLSTTASTDEELKKAISLLPHLVEQFYRIIEHRIDGDFDEDLQRMQD